MYEFFLKFLESRDFDAGLVKPYIDQHFVCNVSQPLQLAPHALMLVTAA